MLTVEIVIRRGPDIVMRHASNAFTRMVWEARDPLAAIAVGPRSADGFLSAWEWHPYADGDVSRTIDALVAALEGMIATCESVLPQTAYAPTTRLGKAYADAQAALWLARGEK